VVHLGDEHRRHAVYGGAALGLYGFKRGERIEPFARIDHRRPVGQAAEIADHHATAVIERYRYAYPVALGELHCLPEKEPVVEDVVVGQRGALWKAGRAAGELDVYRIVELQLFGEHAERVPLGVAGKP